MLVLNMIFFLLGIGTLEIKDISDDTAPIQGGKKIIIVCHKLKIEKNEKIIPEFIYYDQTKSKIYVLHKN